MTDAADDYKSAPLMELEKYLAGEYKRILAISDEKGVFPNGDLDFLSAMDFRMKVSFLKDEIIADTFGDEKTVMKRLKQQV